MVRTHALMESVSGNLHGFPHSIETDLTRPQKQLLRDGLVGLLRHRRALVDPRDSRTPPMGGRLHVCNRCRREHYVYHSCGNHACPKRHGKDSQACLTERRKGLLPLRWSIELDFAFFFYALALPCASE